MDELRFGYDWRAYAINAAAELNADWKDPYWRTWHVRHKLNAATLAGDDPARVADSWTLTNRIRLLVLDSDEILQQCYLDGDGHEHWQNVPRVRV